MKTRSGKDINSKREKPPPLRLARPKTKPKPNYEKKLREKDQIISKLKKQLGEAYEDVESVLHKKIKDLLSCAICFQMLQQPYMLPTCGHTFCSGCIVGWRFTSDKNSGIEDPVTQSLDHPFTVPCPICRKDETRQLGKNLLIQSLVFTYAGDVDM